MIESFTLHQCQYIPEKLEQGIIYYSAEFGCAIHLCACGCGNKTAMSTKPMWDDGWDIEIKDGKVTFHPSVGNQQFPCKSHYWIRDGETVWA